MPGEFVFVPTHYSPELQSELAKALRARTEIVSRKKNPKLWRMTDGVNRFAEECRADDPLLKRRGIVLGNGRALFVCDSGRRRCLSACDGADGAEEYDAACNRRHCAGDCSGAVSSKTGCGHDKTVSEVSGTAFKKASADWICRQSRRFDSRTRQCRSRQTRNRPTSRMKKWKRWWKRRAFSC